MTDQTETSTPKRRRLLAGAASRLVAVIVLLTIVIAVMLLLWKPWKSTDSGRTVQVTGETTIKAEPDEYVFAPNYQFRLKDNANALADANKKSQEVIKAVKDLGVAENKIKSSVNGYDEYSDKDTRGTVYTLTLVITVNDRELAQKVQDYIVTTSPTGNVSPQANFSKSKRKSLEQQARNEAIEDAKSKAEQNAKNLGFKVGAVKEVSDGGGFGGIPVYDSLEARPTDMGMSGLGLFPGENELTYTVNVTFFVK